MRKHGPDGKALPPDAYVFGNEIGERVRSTRTAWENARMAAGLPGLHLADLRHEAASRFDEASVPINFVSKILGHADLSHHEPQFEDPSARLAHGDGKIRGTPSSCKFVAKE
jgi:integrase